MLIEVSLQSLDRARPNNKLWEQIEARQDELTAFLRDEDTDVEEVEVAPKAGFPTGLETFVILVTVAFATGAVKGFVEGAAEEIAKPVGEHVGRKVGARIRKWLENAFPDIDVTDVT